jgi:hypothetical protein
VEQTKIKWMWIDDFQLSSEELNALKLDAGIILHTYILMISELKVPLTPRA